ncbi:M14 family zinc carboxypeptidase [Ruania rhizosphaerae]|uniref:M14 family zinc carboxypeptidase n=1 Tax=Ruania rhizosphaerae TaxID=1840413 RepID=UPI00135A46D2|nr:M14 family zinc carboxypeptidase [Ruania rhizosphaerae]
MTDAIPAWLSDELATVPSYDAFLGVDALVDALGVIAAAHPDLATLRRVGTSRQGEALWCLTIADTAHDEATPDALVVGLPHPNEPIGGLTALHLAARVCADADLRGRLGHRWHVVACVDPDGLRLNEGWLAGPFDRTTYARNFYRPAGVEQVEWTFPVSVGDVYYDDAIAETQALMRLIDHHEPALLASLHNSELGGAYYYLSRPEPPLHAVLQAVPESVGIPLDRGEPEAAHMVTFDDAIFAAGDAEAFYARLRASGRKWPPHGGSTSMYAARHGTLTILSELPYWSDPSAADSSPSGVRYADALAAYARGLSDAGQLFTAAIDEVEELLVAPTSPLWKAGCAFGRATVKYGSMALERSQQPKSDREATVAEAASIAHNLHAWRLRYGGMLLRALEGEVALGNVREPLRRHAASLATTYDAWLAEDAAAIQHDAIPIRNLVTVQYAAIVAAAAQLAGTL